ncbi:organic cation transporter protein-like isoform X2 [Mytilus californianus]|nr:organic cation transporter protein-like isoform X2 [Mytilus californianus]
MDPVQAGKMCDLFTNRVLLFRTLIIFFNWIGISMGYYGLSLSTHNLSGNFYLNFILSGITEFIAYTLCLVFLDRVGRKKFHASCVIIGGFACLSTIFTMLYAEESLQPITVALSMFGKTGIAASFACIYVWAAELYPTVVRNTGIGIGCSFGNIGAMISPYIADINKLITGNLGRALPFVIFGSLSILAGILSLWLPETLNHNLPETIEDGIHFGR